MLQRNIYFHRQFIIAANLANEQRVVGNSNRRFLPLALIWTNGRFGTEIFTTLLQQPAPE